MKRLINKINSGIVDNTAITAIGGVQKIGNDRQAGQSLREITPSKPLSSAHSRRQFIGDLGRWSSFAAALTVMPLAACGLHRKSVVGGGHLRVVSIGGALTEMVYALGAGQVLVGADTTSTYPVAETAALAKIGYARALSGEGILALSPNLIIATEDAGPPAVMSQLTAAGVKVEVLSSQHRFEGVIDRINRLGELLDKKNEAAQLTARISDDWQLARAKITAESTPPPKVLFVLSHTASQIMVAGQKTSAEAMMAYAGAHNAVQGFENYKPLTPEGVISAQPDVVLFSDQGLQAIGGVDGALKLPGIAQTPAGKARRIVSMEAMMMLGFGPRIAQALTGLDQLLHPTVNA